MKRLLACLLVPLLMGANARDIAALEAKAREAFRAGEYARAAQIFGDILEALPAGDPTRARTQYNRGRALQEAGRDCAAAEALFGYLSNPASETAREERRRVKARSNLKRARAACSDRKRSATAPPPTAARSVATTRGVGERRWFAQGGLGTGMHLSGAVERARSTVQLGAGVQDDRTTWELGAEIAVESPPGGQGLVLLRPGARFAMRSPFYWRVSVPLLIEPLFAAGVHGGVGLTWPQDGQIAALAEAGLIGWLADPQQFTLDARLGVQARF